MERKIHFSKAREPPLGYNSLMDPHLATYFTNPRIRRHLRHAGLILPDGEAVSEQTYRLFAGKFNQRKQIQEQLMEAWTRESLRLSRSRSVTLSRWIEQLQKHELVNRIREEELKRSGSVPSSLLSRRPGSRSSLVVFNAKAEASSPFKQQADAGKRSSKRVASASMADRKSRHRNRGSSCASTSVRTSSESSRGIESARRKFPSRSNSFSSSLSPSSLSSSQSSSSFTSSSSSSSSVSSLSSENESYLGSSYSQSLLSSEVSSQVKAKATNRRIIRIPRTDSRASCLSSDVEKESSASVRPKSAALQGFRVPHPPKGEGSRSQINDKTDSKNQRVFRKLSGASEQKCGPSTPFFSAIRPNLKHSGCLVTLHFLGSALELQGELTDKCNDIIVEQQHCGGNTVTVFKGRIPAKSDFAFYSYRRHHYPFSVTIYVDGRQDSRLSVCCEYKHSTGVRLGGLKGHFAMVGVRGGKPCYRCQIKAQVKDEDKQKKHENYSSDCNQHQEKDSVLKKKSKVSYVSQNYDGEKIVEKEKRNHDMHRTKKRDEGKQNKKKIKINNERQRMEEVREVSHSESDDDDESNKSQQSSESTEEKSDDDLDGKDSQINKNEVKRHAKRKSKKNYEGNKKNKSKGEEQHSHETQEHKHKKHRKHSKNRDMAVASSFSAGKARRKNSSELVKDSPTKFKHNEHNQEKYSEPEDDDDDDTVTSCTPPSSGKDRLHIDTEVLEENANSPHSSAKDNHAERDLKQMEKKKKSSHANADSKKSRKKKKSKSAEDRMVPSPKANGYEEEFESADERKLPTAVPGDVVVMGNKELPEQQQDSSSSSDEDPDDVENGNVKPAKPLLAKKHNDIDKTHKDNHHQLSPQGSSSDDESEDQSTDNKLREGTVRERKGEDSHKETLSSSRSRSILLDSEDHGTTHPRRMKDKDSQFQKEELAQSASEEISKKVSSPVKKRSDTTIEDAAPGRHWSDQRNSISDESDRNEDDSPRIINNSEKSRPDEINSNISRESNNENKEAEASSVTTGSLDWNAAKSCKNTNNENDSDF